VDEAHSSQSGESTKSLKAVLASGSLEDAEAEEAEAETPEEELENTILANSTAGGDCSGSVITSSGHNLIEDTSGCTIIGTTGNVTGTTYEEVLRTMGRVMDPRAFNDVVVTTLNAAPVRIRDIGWAEDGTRESARPLFVATRQHPAVDRDERRRERLLAEQVLQHVGRAEGGLEDVGVRPDAEHGAGRGGAREAGDSAGQDAGADRERAPPGALRRRAGRGAGRVAQRFFASQEVAVGRTTTDSTSRPVAAASARSYQRRAFTRSRERA